MHSQVYNFIDDMIRAKRDAILQGMRQRIIRALATGALRAGDRLPSTRELSAELDADPRLIGDAYRNLQDEGLVELRMRSGVYVSADAPSARLASQPPAAMLVDLLASASLRGHPGPMLVKALSEAVTSRALRAIAIAGTADQGLGLARELREDFGLDASSVLADRLNSGRIPDSVRRSHLLVTTKAHAPQIRDLAAELHKPLIVVGVREDVFESEWSLWRGETVHVIVLDPRFRALALAYLKSAGAHSHQINVHLATESLVHIPADGPTYVTQAARAHLGKTRIPGVLIPPTRLLDDDCVRALWEKIVSLNLKAAMRDSAD